MGVVSLPPDQNQQPTKHVESLLIPRLDEGSSPSSSTNKPDYQVITKITPNFTPINVRLGIAFSCGSKVKLRKTKGKKKGQCKKQVEVLKNYGSM